MLNLDACNHRVLARTSSLGSVPELGAGLLQLDCSSELPTLLGVGEPEYQVSRLQS